MQKASFLANLQQFLTSVDTIELGIRRLFYSFPIMAGSSCLQLTVVSSRNNLVTMVGQLHFPPPSSLTKQAHTRPDLGMGKARPPDQPTGPLVDEMSWLREAAGSMTTNQTLT